MKKIKEVLDKSNLVEAENLNMFFKIPEAKHDSLKEKVIAIFKRNNKYKKHVVLDNLSFNLKRGESLGVIGHNGAGKSTLLKIVAGIYHPRSGNIRTQGRIVLLNLGAGFDMEATGEENVFLNGAILGFTRKEMKERYSKIVEFAELHDFMKLPLKNYSSGMVSRLGFAVAIDLHPDLMLVDEVLSVGDENFRNKCLNKISELQKEGVSFLFVSHNIDQVKFLCDKTMWIENSKLMAYGDSNTVCDQYLEYCKTHK
jgi:ABC-type polysaccharide/polyol phosphate transport system ATPase subunit